MVRNPAVETDGQDLVIVIVIGTVRREADIDHAVVRGTTESEVGSVIVGGSTRNDTETVEGVVLPQRAAGGVRVTGIETVRGNTGAVAIKGLVQSREVDVYGPLLLCKVLFSV